MRKTRGQPTDGKRHPLNMRTTEVVREALESAAAESGRSLSQEVEFRLTNSFRDQYLLARIEALVPKIIETTIAEIFKRIEHNRLLRS